MLGQKILAVSWSVWQIEDSPQQATGNLHRKDVVLINIRSLTPLQDFGELSRVAAGNALAHAVQAVRTIWALPPTLIER